MLNNFLTNIWYKQNKPQKPIYLLLGKWETRIEELNEKYDNLGERIIKYALDLGRDPYDRTYNFEKLIDFAINKEIGYYSIDYIYRHYVYHQLSILEHVDVEEEEKKVLVADFFIIQDE